MERVSPDPVGDERTLLGQFLDFHRATIVLKASGLDGEQNRFCLPTSTMTVGGMLKHLTLVEDHWFSYHFAGDAPREPWASVDWDDDPDWEWRTAADDSPVVLIENYEAACERSRMIAGAAETLDALAARSDEDEPPKSLRWVLLHMLEETARHVGHIDLIRQAIDGETGE